MTELEHAIKHIKTRADAWAVKEVTEALQSISERMDKALSVNPQPSEHFIDGVHAMGYREGYKDAQKQKSGKWIDYRDDGFVECPFCGHATNCEDNIDELHYCFYCGARMVEPRKSEEIEIEWYDLDGYVGSSEK